MAPKKKVSALIKLQIQAGKANPAPPLGPALGSHGVNIMDFCKAYNAQTQDKMGQVIPVEITVYEDRSFTFVLKTPPAAALLKKAGQEPSYKVHCQSKDDSLYRLHTHRPHVYCQYHKPKFCSYV